MGELLVALDSFKGSIGATQATAALARGLHRHPSKPVVREHPVADGGEGTVSAAVAAGSPRSRSSPPALWASRSPRGTRTATASLSSSSPRRPGWPSSLMQHRLPPQRPRRRPSGLVR
jgi:hypothetical protein